MNETAEAYFESLNPLTKKIVKDTRLVQALFGEKWAQFDDKSKDDILDDYFVHPDVREKYKRFEKLDEYPMSYPVLKVQMGEKIVVDETNDFWTWQDEFSGPFSWKTKSQQDLTLLDLEPEQMTKQSKTRRRSSKDISEDTTKKAPREFSVQDPEKSLWHSEFKNLKNVRLPTKSNIHRIALLPNTNGTVKVENSPEEVNYAFNRDSFIDPYPTNQNSLHDQKNITDHNLTLKEETVSDGGFIAKRRPDIEMSVFENPMITHVIEDEDSLSSATTSPSHRPLLKGCKTTNMSPSRKPLLKGDSQDSSNSGKSQVYEPEKQSIDHADRYGRKVDDKTHLVSDVDYEDTELITVDVDSESHTNDQRASMDSFDLPKTGFDFLDQW